MQLPFSVFFFRFLRNTRRGRWTPVQMWSGLMMETIEKVLTTGCPEPPEYNGILWEGIEARWLRMRQVQYVKKLPRPSCSARGSATSGIPLPGVTNPLTWNTKDLIKVRICFLRPEFPLPLVSASSSRLATKDYEITRFHAVFRCWIYFSFFFLRNVPTNHISPYPSLLPIRVHSLAPKNLWR